MTELPPLPYGVAPAEPATKRGFGSGAGRRLGQKDRVSVALKQAIILAAEVVGDEIADAAEAEGKTHSDGLLGYLAMVARSDTKSFCGLLGKVLPMTIKGEGDNGGIIVEIVRMAAAVTNATGPASP